MSRTFTPTNPARLLLVGAGKRATAKLLPALHRAGLPIQVSAICDPSPATPARVTELVPSGLLEPEAPVFTNLDAALDAVPYDVGLVACPHDHHHDATMRLARAGVTVWKEKPYALTLGQAVELAQRDVRLLVHRPHGQLVRLATDLLNRWGRLLRYEIRITRATTDYSGTWRASARRSGGGAVADLGYHAFDLISRWATARPAAVYAVAAASPAWRTPVEVEETADLTITHIDGCVGTVHVSRCQDRTEAITLEAEHGRIAISGGHGTLQVNDPGGPIHHVDLNATDDPVAAMLRYHTRTHGDRAITAAEALVGLSATALLDAATTSLRTRRPVPVANSAALATAPKGIAS